MNVKYALIIEADSIEQLKIVEAEIKKTASGARIIPVGSRDVTEDYPPKSEEDRLFGAARDKIFKDKGSVPTELVTFLNRLTGLEEVKIKEYLQAWQSEGRINFSKGKIYVPNPNFKTASE